MKLLFSVIGIIVGLVIGTIIISAGGMIMTSIFPPGAAIDPRSADDLRIFYASRPTGWFIGMLVSYFLGVFFAAFAAAKIAGRAEPLHGFIMTLLYVAFGILKLSEYPEPTWVMITSIIIYFMAGLAGSAFAGSLRKARTAE